MNERNFPNAGQNENYLINFRQSIFRFLPHGTKALNFFVVLCFTLFTSTTARAQDAANFGIDKIIQNVKKRFKLNAADVRNISPLIKKENKNVIIIYARFGGDEPEYSPVFWDEIVERRLEFETRVKGENLTIRQKAALRAVRTALEKRILNFVVDDFISFLSRYLELNSLEYESVRELYYLEQDRKYQLVASHFSRPDLVLSSPNSLKIMLDKISEETQRRLEKILSPKQMTDFHLLSGSAEKVIATLTHRTFLFTTSGILIFIAVEPPRRHKPGQRSIILRKGAFF